MRAAAIVLVLLLGLPLVAGAGWFRVSYREMEGPGWYAETFKITNPNASRIWIEFDSVSSGELTGHLLALYDGAGTLLRGTTYFSEGGQAVEATISRGEFGVTNEAVNATASSGRFLADVIWSCNAACNPSRTFTLVIASGGEMGTWRYVLLTNGSAMRIANTSGDSAWAYNTRQFEGNVVHVQTPFRGLHRVEDGSMSLHADGIALATFVKPDPSPDPLVMAVEGAVDQECPCFAGDWPAGDYTFRYEDQDLNGVEGMLAFADVHFP